MVLAHDTVKRQQQQRCSVYLGLRMVSVVAAALESATQRTFVVQFVDRSVQSLVKDVLQPSIHVRQRTATSQRRHLVQRTTSNSTLRSAITAPRSAIETPQSAIPGSAITTPGSAIVKRALLPPGQCPKLRPSR